jgi:hypothetical protein
LDRCLHDLSSLQNEKKEKGAMKKMRTCGLSVVGKDQRMIDQALMRGPSASCAAENAGHNTEACQLTASCGV